MSYRYHPDLHKFMSSEEAIPDVPTIAEKRAVWREFCLGINRPVPETLVVESREVAVNGVMLPIRIYRPVTDQIVPVTVYIHGGGWVVGDLDTNDTVAWGLAEGTRTAVVSIHYRMAPEHPYPAAFDDCYALVEWVAANASTFGGDGSRLAVCGDSAGGNLSAAISLAARDRGGPAIAAQGLIFPVLGLDMDLPSYHDNAEGFGLTRESMIFYLDAYLPDKSRVDAYAMPLLADDLSNLPPALVHTAEFDPLRDEGKLYADRLAAAGNDVTYRMGDRMTHSFIRARFDGTAVAAEFQFIVDFLKKYLFA
ncbi:MAG: alpha/beta hydrolase [Ardenticatenaceae bacterium]|nr:alpha/beta hydrolase [Ardenticatenaceae bacterium]